MKASRRPSGEYIGRDSFALAQLNQEVLGPVLTHLYLDRYATYQDHDDVANTAELVRNDTGYKVEHRFDSISSNAMDPCDPDINSRSCPLHPE